MSDKIVTPSSELESRERTKRIWKNIGFMGIAIVLAVVTVFVLFLGK